MADPDCIFCKILAGELPGTIVDEDERTIAFMDIAPATRGHALVIPRVHTPDLLSVDPEDLRAVAVASQRLAVRAMSPRSHPGRMSGAFVRSSAVNPTCARSVMRSKPLARGDRSPST